MSLKMSFHSEQIFEKACSQPKFLSWSMAASVETHKRGAPLTWSKETINDGWSDSDQWWRFHSLITHVKQRSKSPTLTKSHGRKNIFSSRQKQKVGRHTLKATSQQYAPFWPFFRDDLLGVDGIFFHKSLCNLTTTRLWDNREWCRSLFFAGRWQRVRNCRCFAPMFSVLRSKRTCDSILISERVLLSLCTCLILLS